MQEPTPNSSIEDHFQFYMEKSFTKEQLNTMSHGQIHEMTKCFMAGMSSAISVFTSTALADIAIVDLTGQLLEFWAKEKAKFQKG